MCKVCDKLDSMIECLESLHSQEELKDAMLDVVCDDEDHKDNINQMTKNEIYIRFAIDLMIHWVDKYDADPLTVLGVAAHRYSDRMKAHAMDILDGDN